MDYAHTWKFPRGILVSTPCAIATVDERDMHTCLERHLQGDWGDCTDAEREDNDIALRDGFRIWSVYHDRHGTRFWIITEPDRSVTSIILPGDD